MAREAAIIRTGQEKILQYFLPWEMLGLRLEELADRIARQDAADVRDLLTDLVPEYRAGVLTDWVASAAEATKEGIVPLHALKGG